MVVLRPIIDKATPFHIPAGSPIDLALEEGNRHEVIQEYSSSGGDDLLALTIACSNQNKAPDVSQDVRHALDQAGFNNVGVSQDREKNVVTLSGNVNSDDDKSRAESVAKSAASPVVVADEIGVRPSGEEGTAKKVDTELDPGIDKNLEAILVQHKLNKDVKYDLSNGVVAQRETFRPKPNVLQQKR